MSDYISKHCEPCYDGQNQTHNATKYCVSCEESLCGNCTNAHKTQKATRTHDLTDIKQYFESTESLSPSSTCEPCSENDVTITASYRCVECDESYCDYCARIHRSQKATRSHKVIEIATEKERAVCEACSYDGIDRPASSLCITCDEVLCSDCTMVHKSQKATRTHELQECKKAEEKSPVPERKPDIPTKSDCCDICKEYKNVSTVAEAFCFNCRTTLCHICVEDHGKSSDTSEHRIINSTTPTNEPELDEKSIVDTSRISDESDQVDKSESDDTDVDNRCGHFELTGGGNSFAFCVDCNLQLCLACSKEHQQCDDTKLHRLLFDDEMKQEDSFNETPAIEIDQTYQNESEDSVKAAEPGLKDVCQSCQCQGTFSPVAAFCFDCLQTLCDACVTKHTEAENTKTHTIINRNDAKEEAEKGAEKNKDESKKQGEVEKGSMTRTQPGKPMQVGALKVDRITITWVAPENLFESCSYQVRYKEAVNDSKWQYYDEDKTSHTSLTVKNLKSHSAFLLQVRMVNNETEGPYGEISDPIETLPSSAEIVLCLSDEVSDLGNELKLRKFRLNENTAARNPDLKTKKLILGEDQRFHQKEKTILLLGACGTGKTTFVNGLVNYIFGVTFADMFRFSIVDTTEDEIVRGNSPSKALPQTNWITCYTVFPVKGSKIDFTLTIIDTPGFGDKGIERDTEIKQQLTELFSAVDEKGVLFVDAVCIFMRASESRLTVTQEYIYTTITSLFHRDIKENICSIVTFSDGNVPPVLSALKDANLPHETYFPFNTTEIFADNLQTSQTSLTKVFFELNASSFESFMKKLGTLKTKSLSQSTEVIQKRQKIEVTAEILLSKVESGLNKMVDCKSAIADLEKFKTQMIDNKDFKYKRKKHVQNLIPLEKGCHTTNCLHCNVTCHENCVFANDEDKARCAVMNKETGYCTVCEDRCFWKEHKNTPFIIEWLQVEEEGTYEEMMQKYQNASSEVVTHESIVNKLKKELDEVENEMIDLMKEITDCSNQLSEMALRANPLSVAEHIDIIIENEKWERRPGFKDRINNLEKLKRRIAVGDEFEHFQKSKENIYNK